MSIERPEYVDKPRPAVHPGGDVQTPETIEKMRLVGRIAAQALQEAGKAIAPGVTTPSGRRSAETSIRG